MTSDEMLDAYEAWKGGASQEEIARDMGVSQSTISRAIRKMRRAESREEERVSANRDRVLAGDKHNGLFRSIAPNTFEGT